MKANSAFDYAVYSNSCLGTIQFRFLLVQYGHHSNRNVPHFIDFQKSTRYTNVIRGMYIHLIHFRFNNVFSVYNAV
jgi:hypothetical protein